MSFNFNTIMIEAKEKFFELIIIPVKFWFGLPEIVHLIFYWLLVLFGCFIVYIIYSNRGEIFHKP